MNSFLKQTGLFLISALLVYSVLMFIPINYPNLLYLQGANGHMNSRMKEVKQKEQVDILFLGSSHTYRGFDPRIFASGGYSSFNLGSSNQTHLQTEVLLNRYLDQLNPRIAIYEVNPELFVMDGVESSLDLIANDQNDFYSLWMAIKMMHLKTWNSLIYSFSRQIIGIHDDYKESDKKNKDQYIPGGFVEMEMKYYQNENPPEYPINLNQAQTKAFENNLYRLKNKNILVLLVYAPTTKKQYNSYLHRKEFEQWISSKGRYLDFNHILNLEDSVHFADSEHLNRSGVGIFNLKLMDFLLEPENHPGD